MRFLQSEVGSDPIVVEGLFRAPLSKVYRAWTEPDELVKWFGQEPNCLISASVDLRVGGAWRFVLSETEAGTESLQGAYSIVEKEQCLSFSWQHVREHADGRREETPQSTVTVTFRAEGASTLVQLRHDGIARLDSRTNVGGGWDGSFHHLAALLAEVSAAEAARIS